MFDACPVTLPINPELLKFGALVCLTELVYGGVELIIIELVLYLPLARVSSREIGLHVQTIGQKGLGIVHIVGRAPEYSPSNIAVFSVVLKGCDPAKDVKRIVTLSSGNAAADTLRNIGNRSRDVVEPSVEYTVCVRVYMTETATYLAGKRVL